MMKVLPETTNPAPDRIRRQHLPRQSRYTRYRSCLRWEFGFCCPLCLLHEADLAPASGSEGWGLLGAEHLDPVSAHPELRDEYGNLLYVCRLCNGARGAAPVDGPRGRLLNPCAHPWAGHFTPRSDLLEAAEGDPDASYTAEVYGLNDRRKVALRRLRRERIQECRAMIHDGYHLVARLLAKPFDSVVLETAELLFRNIRAAKKDLERYRAIPMDAPEVCRCETGKRPVLGLPDWLEAQVWSLEDTSA